MHATLLTFVALGGVMCLAPAGSIAARGLSLSQSSLRAAERSARAEAGDGWMEFLFPAVATGNSGCARPETLPSGGSWRRYQWHATANFRDGHSPHNHFMGIYGSFLLRDGAPVTNARLDSALATVQIIVQEARGEPPMATMRTMPTRAWARRVGQQVRVRVEGRDAVAAFQQARSDSVSLGWCQRDVLLPVIAVPLRRR